MNFFLINASGSAFKSIEDNLPVEDINKADQYGFKQYIFNDSRIRHKTIYVSKDGGVYCCDISLISRIYHSYFYIGDMDDNDISFKINHFFSNLTGIFLHTLSLVSKKVSLNKEMFLADDTISIKEFLLIKDDGFKKDIYVDSEVLVPSNLSVNDALYKLYALLEKRLSDIDQKGIACNIFFKDFILSLLPEKYWCNSLFFLNSKLKFKISTFFNKYNDIISLHIPVARSKYIKDLFDSLLLQTNKNFKIFVGVDGYDEKHKKDIVKAIESYKDKFPDFHYFVNKKNIGVGKTRWKLLNGDKDSRYIVLLDDDNFLSDNSIDFLYDSIRKYPKMGMYSMENIDVRYDADYRDFVKNKGPFDQPSVYTNRERINRLPLYCDQEETPLIHNRFYSDLLNIKYDNVFDGCSIDMVYNRFLEITCGNIDLVGAYQFQRIGHQFHQTRTQGFNEKEFRYVMFILKMISYYNNNCYYYTYLIKTQVPKQNELFTN